MPLFTIVSNFQFTKENSLHMGLNSDEDIIKVKFCHTFKKLPMDLLQSYLGVSVHMPFYRDESKNHCMSVSSFTCGLGPQHKVNN